MNQNKSHVETEESSKSDNKRRRKFLLYFTNFTHHFFPLNLCTKNFLKDSAFSLYLLLHLHLQTIQVIKTSSKLDEQVHSDSM